MSTTNVHLFPGQVKVAANVSIDTNVLYVDSVNDRVGIKSSTPGYTLDVVGTIHASGNITAFSDIRGKEDITRIEDALDKISKLCGYTYTLKSSGEKSTGLIAQEVLEVLPEVVVGSEETNYSLSYGNMMGLIIESIKELREELESIKDKLVK